MVVDGTNEHRYAYDVLYQLIDVNYPGSDFTKYYYDALSNRTDVNESGTMTDYRHNRLNQYTSVDSVPYTYDDNGNLTNDGTYKYYYDCENRLTDVNDQSNSRWPRISMIILADEFKRRFTIHKPRFTILTMATR